MNKKNSPEMGHNKNSFLDTPVEHIDITSFDARKIIDSIISLASNFVMSMCSTGLSRKDFLLCPAAGLFFLFIKLLSN